MVEEIYDNERPLINAEEDSKYQRNLTEVGPVYAEAPTFDGSTHWATYIRPVSYTHLDVYKRQDFRNSIVIDSVNISGSPNPSKFHN